MKTMLFGPIDNMLEVPYPEQGMSWDHNRDTEVTDLLSGGRHVYAAPTPFKTFGLSYKGGTKGLQPLVDLRHGVYGDGPFYLIDFNFTEGNVLPTRWASAYMLAHIADGWADAALAASTTALARKVSVFRNNGQFTDTGDSLILPVVPDKGMYLRVWGSATGDAGVTYSRRNASTGVWSTPTLAAFNSEVEVVAPNSAFNAVRLRLRCTNGAELTLDHINLMTTPGITTRQPGLGVGAVKFSGNVAGNIVTKRFDRIGLSLDLTEIE